MTEKVEVVNRKTTLARLISGYVTEPDVTAQMCIEQIKDLDTELIMMNSIDWTTYVNVMFNLTDLHLRACDAVSPGPSRDGDDVNFVELDDDEEFMDELIAGYASGQKEIIEGTIATSLFHFEDADTARKNGDIGWQAFLLETREIARMTYKAMDIVVAVKQNESKDSEPVV